MAVEGGRLGGQRFLRRPEVIRQAVEFFMDPGTSGGKKILGLMLMEEARAVLTPIRACMQLVSACKQTHVPSVAWQGGHAPP